MTKRNLFIATLMLILPGLAFAGTCNPDVATHGTVTVGIEKGCWIFLSDDGNAYQILGGPRSMLQDGLTGVLTGRLNLAVTTICMQGVPVDVCSFDADNVVNMVGTLRYEATTGCWLLESGQTSYLMLSDAPGFYVDGAKVKISGVPATNIRPLCQVDGVIDVLSFTFIGGGNAKAAGGNNHGRCHAEFVQCRKTCSVNPCFVSCEDIYDWCLAGQ